jgi:isopentenyl-diphosphate delta-isomerase type 1
MAMITAPPEEIPGEIDEWVVLLGPDGTPTGEMRKRDVHDEETPLHLAFSCYVFDRHGRTLLTQRSRRKRTWPGVWTNACCGHPMPGESIRDAVGRRVREELGVHVTDMALAFPDFRYRSVMPDGTVENELCPVVIAAVDGDPVLNPDEVEDARWCSWEEFLQLAGCEANMMSPWSVAQAGRFRALHAAPTEWLHGRAPVAAPNAALSWPDLDVRPMTDGAAGTGPVPAVEAVLESFLGSARARLVSLDPDVAPMADVIERLVRSGGKRLRPQFVHWGHRAACREGDEDCGAHAVPFVAAAAEMLHTFALLHDDVMDRSAARRGQPTAHVTLADHHRRHDGTGDADWFGFSAAIVAGDLAFVWAQELFDAAGIPPAAEPAARALFRDLQVEVMAGQFLDLCMARPLGPETDGNSAIAAARHVAMLKSGRYTVTRPLHLGATIAGGDDDLLNTLAAYGDAVGVAFQLRDDVLGLMGDESETGKSASDDVREGKRTVLILEALQRATPAERSIVSGALGNPDLDAATCGRVREIVVRTGALAQVEHEIERLRESAVSAARLLAAPAQHALIGLAHRATERRR